MNIISLLFFLSIAINDTSGIIYDNQTNYSNGIIINRSHVNDIQTDYNNGIIITKKSELYDSELIVTPTITSIPITTSISTNSGGSSGGGSSGGSSGGIISEEDFKNILQFETHENTLLANQPVSYKFKLPIYEVLITGKENEYDVSVRVEILKNKSQKVIINPEGEVLTYFNVISNTKKIKETIIRFKTDTPSYLLKWNNSEWVKLNMIENIENIGLKIPKECIDGQQICYTYQTDFFSNFAIVRNEQLPLVKLSNNKITPIPTANINDNKDIPLTTKQSSGFNLVIAIISFIGLIYKKKQEN